MVGGKKVLQLLLFFFFEETSAFAVGLRRQPCTLPVALSWSPGRLVCCLAFDDEIVGLDAATKDEMEVIAPKQDVKCPDCNLCDGSGRIQGGLGAVLPWIPVKAYRPCPNFIERGGEYKRTGQRFDEIAFGGEGSDTD